jgi:hypothetical protein
MPSYCPAGPGHPQTNGTLLQLHVSTLDTLPSTTPLMVNGISIVWVHAISIPPGLGATGWVTTPVPVSVTFKVLGVASLDVNTKVVVSTPSLLGVNVTTV